MKRTEFLFPLDGDVMIGEADGALCAGGLRVKASVSAPANACVRIAGMRAAEVQAGIYTADVVLKHGNNLLEAVNETSGERHCITAFSWPEAYHTYRFTVMTASVPLRICTVTVDATILFLWLIA